MKTVIILSVLYLFSSFSPPFSQNRGRIRKSRPYALVQHASAFYASFYDLLKSSYQNRLSGKASFFYQTFLEKSLWPDSSWRVWSSHGNFLRISYGRKNRSGSVQKPAHFPAGSLLSTDLFQSSPVLRFSLPICVRSCSTGRI